MMDVDCKKIYMSVKNTERLEEDELHRGAHVTGSMSQNSTTFKSSELFSSCSQTEPASLTEPLCCVI